MGVIEEGEKYLLSIGLKRGAAGLVGFLASAKVAAILSSLGVTIDMNKFQTGIQAVGVTLAVMLHDWFKVKYPDSKWL